MLRILYDPTKDPIAIPIAVEHAGQVAVDHYVKTKTGFDLAVQRAEGDRLREAARKKDEAERAAELKAAAPQPDPDVAAAVKAAAIPINTPAGKKASPAPTPSTE
jgi:hypothetical protein